MGGDFSHRILELKKFITIFDNIIFWWHYLLSKVDVGKGEFREISEKS
jgi:hypothetical protein